MMGKIMKRLKSVKLSLSLLFCFCALMLCSCGKDSHVDSVKKYVENVQSQPAQPLKPIPQLKPYEKYVYPEHVRNPFLPVPNPRQRTGMGPDQNRPRQALEVFPFDSLRMVGTLNEERIVWALIAAPDGVIYRVMAGNYMGQNFGKITEITPKSIKVLETMQVGDAWESRLAIMALTQEQEQEK